MDINKTLPPTLILQPSCFPPQIQLILPDFFWKHLISEGFFFLHIDSYLNTIQWLCFIFSTYQSLLWLHLCCQLLCFYPGVSDLSKQGSLLWGLCVFKLMNWLKVLRASLLISITVKPLFVASAILTSSLRHLPSFPLDKTSGFYCVTPVCQVLCWTL